MPINPLLSQQYERYLPSAFDEGMSMLQKINKVVEFLNLVISQSNVLETDITTKLADNLKLFQDSLAEQNLTIDELKESLSAIDSEVIPTNLKAILDEWFLSGKLSAILNQANQDKLIDLTFRNALSSDRFFSYMFVTDQRNPIYVIGDSISEGARVDDYVNDGWAGIVRKAINLEFGNKNYGFCNFNTYVVEGTSVNTFHKIVARNGFTTAVDPFDANVYGGAKIVSVTAGEWVDVAYTGKDAILVYKCDPMYGAIVEVSVDGVVVGTVDTKTIAGKLSGSFSVPIVISSFGSHTIRLRNMGGTAELLGMVYLEDSSVKTPVLYNVGRSSITASEIPDDILDTYCSGGTAILALGVNDQLTSKPVADFKAKIIRICDNIRGNKGSLIICDFMFSLPRTNEYKTELYNVARDYPEFSFLDFSRLWFGDVAQNKYSEFLDDDGVHPTILGQENIANMVLKTMGLPYTKRMISKLENVVSKVDVSEKLLPLKNGWVNYGVVGVHEQAKCYLDNDGNVHVEAFIKNGVTTQWTNVATLPVGYEPKEDLFLAAGCDTGFAQVTITRTGDIQIVSGTNGWLAFNRIYKQKTV